jgi:predicted MFS family arabinose efflux permease
VIAVGSVASLVGYLLVLRLDTLPDYAGVLLPTVLLIGIGFMLLFPTLNIQATSGVENHEQGLASGLVQTSFQVGGAIGLAIVSAVVAAQAGGSTDPGTLLDAYRSALAVSVVVAALGLVVALSGLAGERRARLALVAPKDEEPCLDQAA